MVSIPAGAQNLFSDNFHRVLAVYFILYDKGWLIGSLYINVHVNINFF